MRPIKNSVVREQIRLKNESKVESREKQLLDQFELYKKEMMEKCDKMIVSVNQQKDAQIKQVNKNMKADMKAANKTISSIRGGSSSPLSTLAMGASLVAASNPVAMVATTVATSVVSGVLQNNRNKKVLALEEHKERLEEEAENEILQLGENAEAEAKRIREEMLQKLEREERKLKDEIRKMYIAADQQTVKELTAYDHEMNRFANNILGDADKYSPMVDAIESVFRDLNAEVKNEMLIKFDVKFRVTKTEVEFDCGNKQESRNYNFFKEGFRELSRDYECEGLAKALLMMTKTRISKTAPTMMMSFGHLDSEVTIHFKGINPNGRPL